MIMAYLYRKNRSPFWYIQHVDSDRKKHDKSTGFRADDPNDTVKAKILRAELETKEYQRVPVVNGAAWDTWVPKFLARHCETRETFVRYEDAWKWIALWLQRQRIHAPRQITYRLGVEYVDWRTHFKKRTGKTVRRNTAILELKLLSLVMGEAVRMGHADANPIVSIKIHREKSPKKPELTDQEIVEIRQALLEEPEWMQICFDISLERLANEKRRYTLEFPFQPSRRWQQFFIKVKKTHLCFHCLRVTYVNRLRRAGVPREVAMRLVNHASELVHQIYQREKVEDLVQWRDAVRFPS